VYVLLEEEEEEEEEEEQKKKQSHCLDAAALPVYFVDQAVLPQEPQTWGNVTRLGWCSLPTT